MNYTKYEAETTVTFSDADRMVNIYSASPVVMRRLDRLCENFPDVYKCIWTEDGGTAKKYTVGDKKYIKFGKPASEAMKQRGRDFAAKMYRNTVEKNA